ncbi:PAS domain-containing protein [uncultured Sneathiella sp.]|uniref:PAS domain-containing protein n=1 Tax=uncultured Sneathiella sp. TaxID=879315 RepID=UPI002599234A|nr:PAS domain-containing protein [uncultured Sneathiella sp.]
MDRIETNLPISSNSLSEIRDYWVNLRQNRLMPNKKHFSPAAIVRHLPNIALVDVFQNPLRFQYRLLGTRITELAGRNATGKWLNEELYGDRTNDILWMYKKCASTRQPVAVREQIQFADKSWLNVDVAAFPMSDTDNEISTILGAVDLTKTDAKLPSPGSTFILNWQAVKETTMSSSLRDQHSKKAECGEN